MCWNKLTSVVDDGMLSIESQCVITSRGICVMWMLLYSHQQSFEILTSLASILYDQMKWHFFHKNVFEKQLLTVMNKSTEYRCLCATKLLVSDVCHMLCPVTLLWLCERSYNHGQITQIKRQIALWWSEKRLHHCRHWSLWQPAMPPVTTKMESCRFCVFNVWNGSFDNDSFLLIFLGTVSNINIPYINITSISQKCVTRIKAIQYVLRLLLPVI